MILEIEEKEPYIYIYLNVRKNKELLILLEQAKYLPTLEKYELLQKKITRLKGCKKHKKVLVDYYLSGIEEYAHYYCDLYDKDIYRTTWRHQKYEKVDLPIGSKLYHLARSNSLENILTDGLRPGRFTADKVYLGCNKIYFSTKPVLDENAPYVDGYLYNRVQLEIIYDGTYELFKDPEYNYYKDHPMVYAISNHNIKVLQISKNQPIRKSKVS